MIVICPCSATAGQKQLYASFDTTAEARCWYLCSESGHTSRATKYIHTYMQEGLVTILAGAAVVRGHASEASYGVDHPQISPASTLALRHSPTSLRCLNTTLAVLTVLSA